MATYNAEYSPGLVPVSRITEDGLDTRVTQDLLDTRIVFEVGNSALSTLTAVATKTPFSPQLYVKDGGAWVLPTPYVKYQGSWVTPDAVYVKDEGLWKRVY